GCEVTLVGPPTLLPESVEGWPAVATSDLDAALEQTDVVYLLRIQHERIAPGRLPSTREDRSRGGLTASRARRLKPDTFVMHPGPMKRGGEIAEEVADSTRSLVAEQVTNGVAVRMAVLYEILGSGGPVV